MLSTIACRRMLSLKNALRSDSLLALPATPFPKTELNPMRAWLMHIGEQLPVDGQTRLMRYGYLAQALEQQGHEVLRWAPAFHHGTKRRRYDADHRAKISERYEIQFVHSPGYCKNAGLARLWAYRVLGRRFRELSAREARPDVIVAAIPSLEWAAAAVDFGKTHGVPVVIDVRDLWPNVFVNALPRLARPLGRKMLYSYERMAQHACREATALTAVSSSYLDWALSHAGRTQRETDHVMPLGFEPTAIDSEILDTKLAELRSRGIDFRRPICFFAGLFERSYDLETVIDAARTLQTTGASDVQFVLCGDGSKAATLRKRAEGLTNVHLLGWVDAAMLKAVTTVASIGLCAYAEDALQSLPNKPFEYMAGGLAILSSLSGEMEELLHKYECGVTYRAADANTLARRLQELLNAPQRLAQMQENGRDAWARHYRSRDIYCRFVDRLSSLATSQAQAA